jgi:hypothetical protein
VFERIHRLKSKQDSRPTAARWSEASFVAAVDLGAVLALFPFAVATPLQLVRLSLPGFFSPVAARFNRPGLKVNNKKLNLWIAGLSCVVHFSLVPCLARISLI